MAVQVRNWTFDAKLILISYCAETPPNRIRISFFSRQWVLRHFIFTGDEVDSAVEAELSFTAKLLFEDPRNNSAWNNRYFVLQTNNKLADPTIVDNEIRFASSIYTQKWAVYGCGIFFKSCQAFYREDASQWECLELHGWVGFFFKSSKLWMFDIGVIISSILLGNGLSSRADVVAFVEDLYERTEASKRAPYLVCNLQ